ncbi:hypothetical protein WJX79_003310 [Trebouxia sp. C0005]
MLMQRQAMTLSLGVTKQLAMLMTICKQLSAEEEAACIPDDVSVVSSILRCGSQDAATTEKPNTELRSYQQRALDQIKSGGNYILVAPTGLRLGRHQTFVPCEQVIALWQ